MDNQKLLLELLKDPHNQFCCDCGRRNPEYASYNIGIFLCSRCGQIHRSLGAHISKIKHLKLDRWESSQLERMMEIGNKKGKLKYESKIPLCYRIPTADDPQVLIEQFIRAKYERKEFSSNSSPVYINGRMEGFLLKRGKEDGKFLPRKFVLNESEDTLRYYVKEKYEPKATLRISEINVVFGPEKIWHISKNSLQLSYMKNGSTRHIYVYHEDPETICNWYMALRCAKLHRYQIAYPNSEEDLTALLTKDFVKEGWLNKTGPRKSDGYKKRWFTLDDRKLMYHDYQLDAYPKGEIFLGHYLDGYSVRVGAQIGSKDQGYSFSVFTPERTYNLSATTDEDRDDWIQVIQNVLDRPLSPQDSSISARLIRKRTGTTSINLFTGR